MGDVDLPNLVTTGGITTKRVCTWNPELVLLDRHAHCATTKRFTNREAPKRFRRDRTATRAPHQSRNDLEGNSTRVVARSFETMALSDDESPVVPSAAPDEEKKKERTKKEEVPIEEIYDLSKPIPKVCVFVSLYTEGEDASCRFLTCFWNALRRSISRTRQSMKLR